VVAGDFTGPRPPAHGHMADRQDREAGNRPHNRRSGGIWTYQGKRSVKPSAKPTLVRTQHLPPAKPQLSIGAADHPACLKVAVRRTAGFARAKHANRRPPGPDLQLRRAGPILPTLAHKTVPVPRARLRNWHGTADGLDRRLRRGTWTISRLRWLASSVRGHEKVPVCGRVVVPAGGQLKVPIPRSSCRPGG
jgi:hypothetical protein